MLSLSCTVPACMLVDLGDCLFCRDRTRRSMYWEVKGTVMGTKEMFRLSLNEVFHAIRHGSAYNLALVMGLNTVQPTLFVFRNVREHMRQGNLQFVLEV